jgi:hypothetical protein
MSRIEPIEEGLGNSLELGGTGWSPSTLTPLSPSMLQTNALEGFGPSGKKKKKSKGKKRAGSGPSTRISGDGSGAPVRERGRARNQRWSAEEDGVLREQVKRFTEIAASEMAGLQIKPSQLPYFDEEGRLHGSIKWCIVAENLPGRVGKQCRERWMNHLDPSVKKCKWSDEEDDTMIAMQRQFGNRWSEIAKSLPGRSENAVKNRWNSRLRKNQLRLKRAQAAMGAPVEASAAAKSASSAAAKQAAAAKTTATGAKASTQEQQRAPAFVHGSLSVVAATPPVAAVAAAPVAHALL